MGTGGAWQCVQPLAEYLRGDYLCGMFQRFEFCIATRSTIVPDGPDQLHEVKYDGFRLRVERDGGRVRLITRLAPPAEAGRFRLLVDGDDDRLQQTRPTPEVRL